MFLERLKTIFYGWLAIKPKQPIDSSIQPIVCFGTITENCFVLWLSIKWFCNWIRSSFKCFDQSLNAINSLFKFSNKQQLGFNQRKTNLSFSLILLMKELEIILRLLGSKRVWYRIFILYWFQIFFVTSVIFCTFEETLCEAEKCCVFLRLSRSAFLVVFVLSQRKCVSWEDQGHFFGGVVSNLELIV